jgi:hypothetical protein
MLGRIQVTRTTQPLLRHVTNTSVGAAAITVLIAVLIAGLVTGCDDLNGAEGAPSDTPSSASPTQSPTPTATPIPSATPPTPTVTPTATPADPPSTARPAGLPGRLLPAEQLPGSGSSSWSVLSTKRAEGSPLAGTCHKFELTSIGGWKVARRLYAPTDGSASAASATVVEFPDDLTAQQAYAVLEAWRDDCAHPGAEVGRFVAVRMGRATGGWYPVTYGTTYDAQGVARQGSRIVVLTMRTDGEAATDQPISEALRRSAALL